MFSRNGLIALIFILGAASGLHAGDAPPLRPQPAATQRAEPVYKPFLFRDPKSQVTLLVESNGHVAAGFDAAWRLLWVEDILPHVAGGADHGREIRITTITPAADTRAIPEGSVLCESKFRYPDFPEADQDNLRAQLGAGEWGWVELTTGKYTSYPVLPPAAPRPLGETKVARPAGDAGQALPAEPRPNTFNPFAYIDAHTGIMLYVESNGHQVAAFDAQGKPLWNTNIIDQGKAVLQGTGNYTHATKLAKAQDWMVRSSAPQGGDFAVIEFNGNDMGLVDLHTGAFTIIRIRMR